MEIVQFKLRGTVIESSHVISNLGVWLDKTLSYAEHINKTTVTTEYTVSALLGLISQET